MTTALADGSLTVGEARTRYFERAGFPPDGGYEAAFVSLGKIGPIPVGFPNTDSRRRAVAMHDLHHVATGYGTDWTGEAEISAWEIAAGCGPYPFAWFINLQGMVMGWVVNPGRTWRAFARGRRSRSLYGLYAKGLPDDVLHERVGELRARLGLAEPAPTPDSRDRFAYAAWCGIAFVNALVLLALPVAAVALVMRALF